MSNFADYIELGGSLGLHNQVLIEFAKEGEKTTHEERKSRTSDC